MRHRAWVLSAMAGMAACDGASVERAYEATVEPPAPTDAQSSDRPSAVDLSDRAGAMTLRLPRPGASQVEVLARSPECREQLEPEGERCRFHGWIRPLSQQCEGGCTWWTYRFEEDRLDVAELERSTYDVDAEYAARFTEEARRVVAELTRRLGVSPQVDELAPWAAVEASQGGAQVLLERQTWALDDVLVTSTLSGHAGHHPGVTLHVRVEAAHPEELRAELLSPELTTGAPLLRLRGGPVARPFDVPLWLTFDARDRAYDNCSLHHEAVVFPLADGRVYVGQYNSWCGSPRLCRVVDPRTGAAEEPPGGCLWGEGIHHRATAIDDHHVLLTSDAEGGGAMEVVRYDPARGADVRLRLSFSAMASIRAEVQDGGVDFSSVCELPPGCEHRDYGEVPSRNYRWTPEHGLVAR